MAFAVPEQKKKTIKITTDTELELNCTTLMKFGLISTRSITMKSQYVQEEKQKKKEKKAKHSTAVKTQDAQQGKSAVALPAGDSEAEVQHETDCSLTGRTGNDRERLNKISQQSR